MSPDRKRNGLPWLLLALVVVAWWLWPKPHAAAPPASPTITAPAATPPVRGIESARPVDTPDARDTGLPAFLPAEARATVALIQRGGPFPHRQDGSVFGNRENRLPRQPRGWYREYTVETPGLDHRGARRIVTGGDPPREWYYTDDHYDSFRRFDVQGGAR